MTAPHRFETAADLIAYLESIGETQERHSHIWVRWDAWEEDKTIASAHNGISMLFVCDVPDCIAVRTRRIREADRAGGGHPDNPGDRGADRPHHPRQAFLNRTGVEAVSTREREIFVYLAHGLSNKEVAEELGISTQTVKNHINTVLRVLVVTNRYEAFKQFGWLNPPPIPM